MSSPGRPGGAGGAGGSWRLRPGVHVVRRDAGHLQVGLDRQRAAVLPDVPAVQVALASLRSPSGGAPAGADGAWVHHRLDRAGLLVDAEGLARDQQEHGVGPALRAHARHGTTAPARLAARRATRVEVVEVGPWAAGSSSSSPVEDLTSALDDHGLRVRRHGSGERAARDASEAGEDRAVVLVLSPTVLRRAEVDPLVRAGLPHLVLAGEGTDVRVGPFVVPGTTACLRCVDAHEAATDPRWPLVREQVAAGDRHPPASSLDWRAATALAARDLIRWVDGDPPQTWSATVSFGPESDLVSQTWSRHPHCGCAWDELSLAADPPPGPSCPTGTTGTTGTTA